MAEQDIPPPTITAMKIPIIRKGEYDIWSMRMRQYICHTDHNLWDVIVNGDLEEEPAPTGETSAPPAPKTAKQLAAKRNQERVKSILLLAIPDEYLLKFHNVADAKSLWEAIKSRFGGNEESKKMQKNVLKHQFEKNLGFEDPDFPNRVYKVEKALYGLHQAPRAWYETLSTYLLDNRFQRGKSDKTLFIKRHKGDILLVQVYVDDIIFGSTKKELCNAFEKLMHEKFQTKVKTESTPMETQKPLLKDEDGKEVDVHMYRSIIGSLMYLTSSGPNIMFAVCACTRYQVNLKVSHLHDVKRIFSDYARASLDRKSTTGGKAKKSVKLMMEKLFRMQLELMVVTQNGKKIIITESTVRRDLQLEDAKGVDCLPNSTIFEQLTLMGSKTTAWNEFSRKAKKSVKLMMEKLFRMQLELMNITENFRIQTIMDRDLLFAFEHWSGSICFDSFLPSVLLWLVIIVVVVGIGVTVVVIVAVVGVAVEGSYVIQFSFVVT
ncbi:putative ribonuclease H-like domain-containing protein [Tanacetum coccineum]